MNQPFTNPFTYYSHAANKDVSVELPAEILNLLNQQQRRIDTLQQLADPSVFNAMVTKFDQLYSLYNQQQQQVDELHQQIDRMNGMLPKMF